MGKNQTGLVVVLRILGSVDLLALLAVFLPLDWMARAHAWLGLGELPREPIVGYLTRSASALYALHGAMILFISFDTRRYARLITFLAVVALVHGVVMLGIDLGVGMPVWWTLLEGPAFAGTGALVLLIQWKEGRG
ncbi:MAG TPA: hypothetical protein VH643_18830 [Gemmataceae bacterium]